MNMTAQTIGISDLRSGKPERSQSCQKLEQQTVMLVSLFPTHPAIRGRRIRLLQLAKALRRLKYRVVLVYQDFDRGDLRAMRRFWGDALYFKTYKSTNLLWQARQFCRRLQAHSAPIRKWTNRLLKPIRMSEPDGLGVGRTIALDEWYDGQMTSFLKSVCEKENPSAVICLDVFMSKSFDAVPNHVLRILDTNDVYSIGREPEELAMRRNWVNLSVGDEIRGYRRADLIWAIQDTECATIRREVPDVDVVTVGHIVDLVQPHHSSTLKSKNIALVASKHKWNVQGLQWFAESVYPRMRDWLLPENVLVAGNIADVLAGKLPFQFLGCVENLTALYKNTRVVISPILGGTGLKIKNIEPMGHGKAVVTTRFAASGLEDGENLAYLPADDPAEFAQMVKRLMEEDLECLRVSKAAYAYAQRWNDRVMDSLAHSLRPLRASNAHYVG